MFNVKKETYNEKMLRKNGAIYIETIKQYTFPITKPHEIEVWIRAFGFRFYPNGQTYYGGGKLMYSLS